ncbi:response regulator [Larkinella bovis]|uniref:Response regulator n=1 Tax=Larkinella bovis TaxID=683041 RepID=A0ABW0I6K7_9BACT
MRESLLIYVVDDDADYRFLVQQVFRRFLPQYSLRLFVDGLALIHHMESSSTDSDGAHQTKENPDQPGLIVLDVDMPRLNGFRTLERLKRNASWNPIPVVLMSNRTEPGFETAARALGAGSYLSKPMGVDQLQTMMTQVCHHWLNGGG